MVQQESTRQFDGNYRQFIHSAYIEPIRTVTLVDDEYPTLDALLENHINGVIDQRTLDTERLKNFISLCRQPGNAWAVDVYDGHNPSIDRMKHLTNSDLVVLDYHLEPGNDDSNDKALDCIKLLAENNHYNLLVIHTKGVEGDIKRVFEELLSALIKTPNIQQEEATKQSIDTLIDDLRDDEEFGHCVESFLQSMSLLSAIRHAEEQNFEWLFDSESSPYFGIKHDILEIIKHTGAVNGKQMLTWLTKKVLTDKVFLFKGYAESGVTWGYRDNDNCNWISAGKLFVTVVKKETTDVSQLPEKLLQALELSKPSPMLLLMARMRFELEENGVEQAILISKQKALQAAWLYQLLSSSQDERSVLGNKMLKNHWDRIFASTKPNLSGFVQGLADCLSSDDPKNILKEIFGDDSCENSQESLLALNSYNCSQEVNERSLMTGHVIELLERNEAEYWVCLSPACDLVPGPHRSKKGWRNRIGSESIPFKAVKLNPLTKQNEIKKALKNSTNDKYLFLMIRGDIKIFEVPDGKPTNPDWEQMFANNNGKINSADNQISVSRIGERDYKTPKLTIKQKADRYKRKERKKLTTPNEQDKLDIKTNFEATVVCQLRYEYALNLLQRLGGTLSRVGLDFVPELW